MNDPIYITGKCHYASITEPNTKFDPVWSIQVEVNDENRSVIEGANLKITNKGDEYLYVKVERYIDAIPLTVVNNEELLERTVLSVKV